MRQIVLALALGLGAVSVANAATVGIGYDNVGISAGHGLNMTLPGGYLKARQDFGPWVASARFEGAGGGMDFRVGPGTLNAGYQYRHLPLSTAHDLHLNTGQFTVGYGMSF
jgi:hypothetical protein